MGRHSGDIHLSPKHRWLIQDRINIALLDLYFDNSTAEMTEVFNHLRRHVLRKEGFKTGMPVSSIHSQLHDLKAGGTGSKLYEKILAFSHDELAEAFEAQLATIRSVAQILGIALHTKSLEEDAPPPLRPRIRRRQVSAAPTETTITTWAPNPDEMEYTPTRAARRIIQPISRRTTNSNNLLPVRTIHNVGMRSLEGPYFVYRVFEVEHGITARRFLDLQSRNLPKPPRYRSRLFTQEVEPHLARDKRYSSPFISFTQSPNVALKHALLKVATGSQVALAIFKHGDIQKEAIARFGAGSGPYLVPVICKEHELNELPGGYTGTGEVLVWGSVMCEPIVIIDGLDALMIRAIMRTTKALDFDAGARLNQYLPKAINLSHLELFLFQLVKSCKVKGHQQGRTSAKYAEFVRGATGVSIKEIGASVMPEAMTDDDEGFDQDFGVFQHEAEIERGLQLPRLHNRANQRETIMIDSSDSESEEMPSGPLTSVARNIPQTYALEDWRSETNDWSD